MKYLIGSDVLGFLGAAGLSFLLVSQLFKRNMVKDEMSKGLVVMVAAMMTISVTILNSFEMGPRYYNLVTQNKSVMSDPLVIASLLLGICGVLTVLFLIWKIIHGYLNFRP